MWVYKSKEWQKIVRESRRVYYETLPQNEKASFLKHIFSSRQKGDYQSVFWWHGKFPGMFEDL